jgi:hypothetical protein
MNVLTLAAGYRQIDTAAAYSNEREGEALAASPASLPEIVVSPVRVRVSPSTAMPDPGGIVETPARCGSSRPGVFVDDMRVCR